MVLGLRVSTFAIWWAVCSNYAMQVVDLVSSATKPFDEFLWQAAAISIKIAVSLFIMEKLYEAILVYFNLRGALISLDTKEICHQLEQIASKMALKKVILPENVHEGIFFENADKVIRHSFEKVDISFLQSSTECTIEYSDLKLESAIIKQNGTIKAEIGWRGSTIVVTTESEEKEYDHGSFILEISTALRRLKAM